jgi:hypothetical protein
VNTNTRLAALAFSIAATATIEKAAVAAPNEDPRVVEARRACAAGQVDRGVDLLASIVAESGDPGAVYNQARCYQQNGRTEDALHRFREYLRIGTTERPSERRKAERFIEELEAELEAKARRVGPPPSTPLPAAAPPPTTEPPPTSNPTETIFPRDATTTSPEPYNSTLRWASYGAGAVGVAGLGFGLYQSLRVLSIEKDLEKAKKNPELFPGGVTKLNSDGKDAEIRQWIGYGVGAASAAGATLLYWLSRPQGKEAAVSFTLPPGPSGSVGLGVSGRF